VCADLAAHDAEFALVGGLAVSARAEPRLTRDVDLAISVPDDAAAEALVIDLVAARYRVDATVEQTKTGRLATVRLVPPGDPGLVVDLLFASCGIESEIVDAAQRIEILPGLAVPVARTGHLIAMKLLARDDRARPQDLDDLRALLAVAKPADRRLVTAAIKQIADRGFARGRDLLAHWRDLTP
jgi:predicted nucleotidyltransferase